MVANYCLGLRAVLCGRLSFLYGVYWMPAMEGKSLYDFYERAVLPQFGIEDTVVWHRSESVGRDEVAHNFSVGKQWYILIFEDYGGLGKDPFYIEQHVTTEKYRFVEPVSK